MLSKLDEKYPLQISYRRYDSFRSVELRVDFVLRSLELAKNLNSSVGFRNYYVVSKTPACLLHQHFEKVSVGFKKVSVGFEKNYLNLRPMYFNYLHLSEDSSK